jgi:hypothetical protein
MGVKPDGPRLAFFAPQAGSGKNHRKVDPMTRHELNDVFATTSFLQGANAT